MVWTLVWFWKDEVSLLYTVPEYMYGFVISSITPNYKLYSVCNKHWQTTITGYKRVYVGHYPVSAHAEQVLNPTSGFTQLTSWNIEYFL